ncbi:vWA domain-containing protein [Saccharibacillus alkalitolerans]|uniref:VWA domain-containing protein n=1 Tax=Saccharibacillus alkalitolerans TaxID=2705290 RepID=A0ABX0FDT7_9BACL|nr:vWA domain-containing protein [Saccharibacillus alkalitolerans]NGZ78029.1 VWA domain-containing protein [Saccharibacillus alkalitolerans]
MRRRAIVLLTGLWAAALAAPAAVPFAKASDVGSPSAIDAVLVLDASHSMEESDPEGVSAEAMRLFIDMLPEEGSRVGIVSYTDVVQRETALLEIRGGADKQELKTFIGGLERGPFTDTSVGVTEAVRMLLRGEEAGRDPLIVLMADGNTSLDSEGTRTPADSAAQLAEAAGQARDAGIPIYTIGLNADGTLNRTALESLAEETGGKAFVTSSAADLPDILSEIFAGHQRSRVIPVQADAARSNEFQEFKINVPDSEVVEANVSVTGAAADEIGLIGPDGESVAIPSAGVALSGSSTYSLLKLVRPERGVWTLRVKSEGGVPVELGLVFSYDFELVTEPMGKYYERGSRLDIAAYLARSGRRLAAPELYEAANATMVVRERESGLEENVPLTLENGRFVGSYTFSRAYDYAVTVRAESPSFYRETEPVSIDVSGGPSVSTQPAAAETNGLLAALAPAVPGLFGAAGAAAAGGLTFWLTRANRRFSGRLHIEVAEEASGRVLHERAADLSALRGRVSLQRLLEEAETAESERIFLRPGRRGTLILRSRTPNVEIRRGGRLAEPAYDLPLKGGDRVTVLPGGTDRVIMLEYRTNR